MAERFYSVKTALRVGTAQILAGLTSIGIGAYNTRNENHEAFIEFKPEGLPVWSGALVSSRIYYNNRPTFYSRCDLTYFA